ncbi:MAG: DNA-directed RNA polymerase III subunit RPC8 [Lasallia pustulata]|uniref:DNA-directed RNA polymerase subunit n=1 Tax=Lasallia pustulata TaxID=136370 RepID=A0A1W5DCU1_9LECA|nr:MAG: DNA-directed RNA polymerase III subunit RPC8 [Lasallia pustulata]SLM40679.1 dna-directed rna polymerase [Lasallia pustulata]
MFILTTISDLVQITPEEFQKPSAEAIEDNINTKYANKVIQKIGLCICLYDILKASDGLIGHGTGIVNVNVEFRLIVFRPFKGEIILGRISSASDYGMKIRLDFFDDINVPPNLMFPGSFFNVQEQCWVWNNEGQEYFYDKYEWVRFRVEQEHWHDQSPVAPSERENISASDRKSPYSIIASMMQAGLGPTEWW